MIDTSIVALAVPAFIAGLLTFLAPCTLPLVPGYLGFISGVHKEDLENPETRHEARRKIFSNGFFFILGFTIIFVLFGTLAGVLGQHLVPYRLWLSRLGGVFVILFGLFMLGLLKLPFLQRERRMRFPSWLTIGKPSSSLVIGSAFALGWTPCVGPIVGSIFTLIVVEGRPFDGAVLLSIFSLGLAIPFLLVALGFSHASMYIKRISKYLHAISLVGGVFLIVLGLLLVTDNFGLTIQYGYELLDFLNYEGLTDLL